MDFPVRDVKMINNVLAKNRSIKDAPSVGMRKFQHRVLCSTSSNFQF